MPLPLPLPPELMPNQRLGPVLDRPGALQASGGLVLGLIALLTFDDHISLAGHNIPLPQQWGIPLIAASVATIFVVAEGLCEAVAQLASRSRLRAAHEQKAERDRADQDRDFTNRERNLASRERLLANRERSRANLERTRAKRERVRGERERTRANRERNAAAAARQRQEASLAEARRSALLSGRFQVDPTPINRERLRLFLELMTPGPFEDGGG
jgi:hypothetical protein